MGCFCECGVSIGAGFRIVSAPLILLDYCVRCLLDLCYKRSF